MMIFDGIQALGAVATAVGVFFGWRELRQGEKQALTDFEDEFTREYRQLAQRIPVKALLGYSLDSLDPQDAERANSAFFHYVDLCNEQVFLRQNGRVSTATWLSWCGGMKSNLNLPAFASAWKEIKKQAKGSFAELRHLEHFKFEQDPITWGSGHLEIRADPSDESDVPLQSAA